MLCTENMAYSCFQLSYWYMQDVLYHRVQVPFVLLNHECCDGHDFPTTTKTTTRTTNKNDITNNNNDDDDDFFVGR